LRRKGVAGLARADLAQARLQERHAAAWWLLQDRKELASRHRDTCGASEGFCAFLWPNIHMLAIHV
jgi:hypothetical protein